MDPTACMREIVKALARGDRPAVNLHCDDLIRWLIGGGFVPTMTPGEMISLLHGIRYTGAECMV